MKKITLPSLLKKFAIIGLLLFSACSSSTETSNANNSSLTNFSWLKLDTVKAGKFDTGKMWTFEYPPLEYFKQEYNFAPSQQWLDNVRMSALKFASYCSASFVSEDGLVMTNDHCARQSVVDVEKEGEDFLANGFLAETLEDERPVEGLYVSQLVLIKDVTDKIQSEMSNAKTDYDELNSKEKIINELKNKFSDSTGLEISITPLYNGAKYSLYGYKKYNDVRLVFSPEHQIGYFGGDKDNFTYPRYNLDCSFFRVYDEDGKPLHTPNYFKWSVDGAAPGEPVFVVGNPARTSRLKTVAQLEYFRDISYPRTLDYLNGMIDVYNKLIEDQPEMKNEYEVRLLSYLNSRKAYEGMLRGLRDPFLMQRKRDFENNFKQAVQSNKKLNQIYGMLWDDIGDIQNELRNISNQLFVLTLNSRRSSEYFFIASEVISLARELKKPYIERDENYKGDKLDSTIQNIFPSEFDEKYQKSLLENQLKLIIKYLGKENKIVEKITNGKSAKEAAEFMLQNSYLTSREKIIELADKGADAILNSDDPFIYFILNTEILQGDLQFKTNQLTAEESVYDNEIGKALFHVYGTSIPPDATFTLRLADGVVKGFPYNGTEAPPITTFYGLYDRYYSFKNDSEFELPERWKNPPADFNLEVPFNFVSTNDIIGGNSGSPVINENAEIVGLAFDGNIQSLPGSFIFAEEENRCVAVHSVGMIEALNKIYKAERLSEELKNGELNRKFDTVKSE